MKRGVRDFDIAAEDVRARRDHYTIWDEETVLYAEVA
jgi:hypothetical protein